MDSTKYYLKNQRYSALIERVIPIKKLFFAVIILVLIFSISGCGNLEAYVMPSDFIEIFYEAEIGEFLGKKDGIQFKNVYTLEGMPSSEYIITSEGYFIGPSSIRIYMDKNSQEPIFRFPINKIEISDEDSKILSIKDTLILEDFSNAMKTAFSREIPYTESIQDNATIYFDLPCKLTWDCMIDYNDTKETVHLICYNAVRDSFLEYDVTTALVDIFKTDEG